MPHNLKLYSEDGTTLVTDLTFASVTPGTVSAALTRRLVNDDSGGAVDTAPDPYVFLMERDPTTGEPLLQGLRGVDERWIHAELTGVSSDDVDQLATGVEPIGRGRVLRTASLPSAGWVQIKFYYAPPASVPSGAASTRNFVVGADSRPVTVVDGAHSESDRDGIIAGIGDGLHTELVIGGTITESATPDEFVLVPDLAWVHEGVPRVLLAHALELDEDDSAAAALVAGEGYYFRLSVGAGASVTITKSVKFTTPGDPDDIPATPAGEISLATGLRTFDATIENADITSHAYAGRFELTWTAGLGVTIGTGWARVDNALIRTQARGLLTLTASQAAVSIWLVGDSGGAYLAATNDGSKPDPRAYLIWTVPTGVSDVTFASRVDYRDLIGPVPETVHFEWDETVNDAVVAHAVWPHPRTGYIVIPNGTIFRLYDDGTGNAAGTVKADLKINGVTAYTSSGTLDRRPSLDFDSDPLLSTDGRPEVLAIPPYALLTAEIDETVAFDATAPSGAHLALRVFPT